MLLILCHIICIMYVSYAFTLIFGWIRIIRIDDNSLPRRDRVQLFTLHLCIFSRYLTRQLKFLSSAMDIVNVGFSTDMFIIIIRVCGTSRKVGWFHMAHQWQTHRLGPRILTKSELELGFEKKR
jgi:hypothetical protein